MKIGYIRVSTEEQNTARQELLMEQLGADKVYIEKQSGKTADRKQLQEMLDFARAGDTIIVESYSRLARSTRDLLSIIDKLNANGVLFVSKKENIDTNTPGGRLMMTIFAGLYQFERENMLQRQSEGIAIAKGEGKYKGRQPIKLDDGMFTRVYGDWKAGNITARQAMQQLNLKANTFYRRVTEYEKSNKIE